jgi:BirA family transcriptional regulator, biotin operon repressor / biotin---[acetyl-CoA-carboxylase] ligase
MMTDQLTDTLTIRDLDALLDGRPFRYYEETTSTNDMARDWQLVDPNLPSGSVVIADEQTAGRGRSARKWHCPAGQAIAMSVIVRPQLNPDELHRVTMMAGVTLAEVLSQILPAEKRSTLTLKWPNDVLIDGKKVCGILSEAVWFGNELDAVILGIGVNVRVDFADTPYIDIATSLEDHSSRYIPRAMLIRDILDRLDYWEMKVNSHLLVDTWREWLSTLGQTIAFETAHTGIIEGLAKDVDSTGALLLEDTNRKVHRLMVGDVLRRITGE